MVEPRPRRFRHLRVLGHCDWAGVHNGRLRPSIRGRLPAEASKDGAGDADSELSSDAHGHEREHAHDPSDRAPGNDGFPYTRHRFAEARCDGLGGATGWTHATKAGAKATSTTPSHVHPASRMTTTNRSLRPVVSRAMTPPTPSRSAPILAWPSHGGARYYRVRIFRATSNPTFLYEVWTTGRRLLSRRPGSMWGNDGRSSQASTAGRYTPCSRTTHARAEAPSRRAPWQRVGSRSSGTTRSSRDRASSSRRRRDVRALRPA
jgi:hypothetical protein